MAAVSRCRTSTSRQSGLSPGDQIARKLPDASTRNSVPSLSRASLPASIASASASWPSSARQALRTATSPSGIATATTSPSAGGGNCLTRPAPIGPLITRCAVRPRRSSRAAIEPSGQTAEKSGAVWLNYSFEKEGSLGGLSAGIGVDYLSKRAGDNAGGVTSASTPTNKIRVQPTFWLPARTLVNANVSYRFNKSWKAQLNIDNLLDEDYLQSSTGRQNVWVGTPLNAKLTVFYNF